MITEKEKDIILQCAKKYRVSSVVLFGSSVKKEEKYNDIDIGVKGIEPRFFSSSMLSYLNAYQNLLILLICPKNLYLTILWKKPA